MNIIIPVDENNYEDATITSLDDMTYWLYIEFDEGKVQKYSFHKSKDEITSWIDIVIVKNNKEYVWPFMEEGIAILTAPIQRSVEDIMEAYIFKELHELTN